MGIFNKLTKLGDITYSSTKEIVKSKSIERKIAKIDREIQDEKNPDIQKYLVEKKKLLQEELLNITREERDKRDESVKALKREVKASIEKRRYESRGLGITSKVRKEFKNLPVVTLFDDLIEGASGIEKVEDYLKHNQENPYAYLLLAEAIRYHKKTFLTIHGIKAPIDIIGTVIDVTSEYVGGFFENIADKDKWTYERALKQALAMAMAKKESEAENLVIVGRSAFLLSRETKNIKERQKYLKLAREFYERSLEERSLKHLWGEVLYYLGEMYGSVGDKRLQVEYLLRSINEGFHPSIAEYRKLAPKSGDIKVPEGTHKIREFKFSYKRNLINSAFSGTTNVITKQSRKIINTTERILDNAVDKFIK